MTDDRPLPVPGKIERGREAPPTAVWVATGFALVLAAHFPTLSSFPPVWRDSIYAHGYLVACVVVGLLWLQRRQVTRDSGGWRVGHLLTAGGATVWLVASALNLQVVHQMAFLLVLVGWSFAVFGVGAGLAAASLAATFSLVVPFWEILIPPLQALTIVVPGGVVALLGIPATIQGELIILPAGPIRVEESCAGLRFLLTGLVLGAVYCHLMGIRWRRAVWVMVGAAALSVVGNWFRVTALVIIGHLSELQSPLMADHKVFSWVVFYAFMVPLFVIAERSRMREVRSRAAARAAAPGGESPEGAGAGGTGAPVGSGPLRRRAAWATAVAVSGPLLFVGFSLLPRVQVPAYEVEAGSGADAWTRVDRPEVGLASWSPAFEGADEHRRLTFVRGDSTVFVDHFLYPRQTQGRELISWANRIADAPALAVEHMVTPAQTGGPWVMEAVVRTPDGPLLVWYWYRVGGMETAFPPRAKLMELVAFFRRRTQAELVALSSPCPPADCLPAREVLRNFLRTP